MHDQHPYLYDIRLTRVGSRKLAGLIAEKARDFTTNYNGDGMRYWITDSPLWKITLKGMNEDTRVLKVMYCRKMEAKESFSFETWFRNKGRNLCQTRIIYDNNLLLRISMNDGWTEEVWNNVVETLNDLGVEYFYE